MNLFANINARAPAPDMSKPKIVRVITASYVVPWHLANTLKRLPNDFEVTVIGQDVSVNSDVYPQIHWVDIDLNRKINLFADLRSLWALCAFFRAHKPDIVHSIMPKAGLLCALAAFVCRVPNRFHTFTGQVWANKTFPLRQIHCLPDRIINALNTVCLSDSVSQSAFLFRHGISHRGKPLPVLGMGSLSGVELSRFAEPANHQQLAAQMGIAPNDFVFSYIARKSIDKGAIDMLHAFAQVANSHPAAKLLFIGPDESEGALASMKAGNPEKFKNVIDIGRVENHEAYLSVSNVLCLPSRREGFGSIAIDAAAAGVPTIGSCITGLRDAIVDGETGVLVPTGDIDKFANTMLSMIANPERCKAMGLAARNRVEAHFTADMMYAALRDLYFGQLPTPSHETQGDKTQPR